MQQLTQKKFVINENKNIRIKILPDLFINKFHLLGIH